MSTGILDQIRAPQSRTAAPADRDRRRSGDAPERARSGQSRSGQSRSGQSRSGQSRSGQSRSGQSRSGQNRARREDPRTGGIAPFVLLIMVLLTSGLVATLWLSTAAAADSYRLDSERRLARDLSEQTERLHREVESARSAPAIAAAAQREGMVPAGEPAVLLVAPNGSTHVIGVPRAARAAPLPAPPAAPTPPAPRPPAPRAVADPEVVAQTGADRPGASETSSTPGGADATSGGGQGVG